MADQLRELGVVDRRLRLLPLEHLPRLRRCEARVEVERVRADLRAGDCCLDEVAVVAREDCHAVALDHSAVLQCRRQGVRATVKLAEAQVAQLVLDRRLVRILRSARSHRGGGCGAPAHQDLDQPRERVRALGTDKTGAGERVEGV